MPPIHSRKIYIAVIGVGGVGRCFLTQLEALAHRYLSHPSNPTELHLVYASRSAKAIRASDYATPLSLQSWEKDVNASSTAPLQPGQLVEFLKGAPGRAVMVDNTSSQDIAETYPAFLKAGISVITPNKKAFASELPLWNDIQASAANGSAPDMNSAGFVYHESTVCACMPVLTTLKDLLETGDIVTRVEGVFSGTMSVLFNNFMPVGGGGASFSDEVKKAKELGYTEPDPRDDLNGMDVARKLTILARMIGLKVQNPSSFPVQSLIPKALESAKDGDEFVARLHEYDGEIEKVKKEAEAEGKILRYVGTIDVQKGEIEVGLRKFDLSAPVAGLRGAEAMVSFYTHRYGARPLVIIGAGAGGDATAMGVTADLIRVINNLR